MGDIYIDSEFYKKFPGIEQSEIEPLLRDVNDADISDWFEENKNLTKLNNFLDTKKIDKEIFYSQLKQYYPSLSDDDVKQFNKFIHSENIQKKVKAAQRNFISFLQENIDSDTNIINEQLDKIDKSLRSKRELELSSSLYFGLPVSQIGTTLTLFGAASAGVSFFIFPLTAFCYSTVYTFNNIKREGISSSKNKFLVAMTLVAGTLSGLAIAAAVGATLPISAPIITGLATVVNLGIFTYSVILEENRNNAAKENITNKIFEISEMISKLDKEEPSYPEKHRTLLRAAQVHLLEYTDTIRTIKSPFAKNSHIKTIRNIKNLFIKKELEVYGELVCESKTNNLFTYSDEILKIIPESVKEKYTEEQVIRLLSAGKPLEGMTKDNEIQHNIQMYRICNNSKDVIVNEKDGKISVNEIALKNKIILQYLEDNKDKKDENNGRIKLLSDIANRDVVDYSKIIYSSALSKDDKKAIEDKISDKNINLIKSRIEDNNLFKDIISAEKHVSAYAARDTIYYLTNVSIMLAGITNAAAAIAGVSAVVFPPTAIAITAVVGLFVISSACLYIKQKYIDKDTKLQEKFDDNHETLKCSYEKDILCAKSFYNKKNLSNMDNYSNRNSEPLQASNDNNNQITSTSTSQRI